MLSSDGDLTAKFRIEHQQGEAQTLAEEYAGSQVAAVAPRSYRYVYDILNQ
jgi:hypothetical protein